MIWDAMGTPRAPESNGDPFCQAARDLLWKCMSEHRERQGRAKTRFSIKVIGVFIVTVVTIGEGEGYDYYSGGA